MAVLVLLAACEATPLQNPTGAGAGLAPTATSDTGVARSLIDGVRTAARGTTAGYDRGEFGASWTDAQTALWGHNGCDTRDDILRRDLADITVRAGTHGCVVLSGLLEDPYTGHAIAFTKAHATKVQIDHVFPLADAWEMGAGRWSTAKRTLFANDPLNLLAVNGPTNESKGDSSPASWLPPNRSIRCSYSVRFAQVARAYDLPVTSADKAMMRQQCA